MLDPSGAVAAVTHNLCNALAAAGCEVHLFTAPMWERIVGRCPTRTYRAHVAFYRWTQSRSYSAGNPVSRGFWRAARLLGHIGTMAKLLLLAGRFDVVHVQWLPVPAVDAIWLWLVGRRVPVVYTVHNLLPHEARQSRAAMALHRWIYRIPRILFVHTRHTARGLTRDFDLPAKQIVEIRHGSMQHLLELRGSESKVSARSGVPVVLFLGQIRHYKGLDTLLRAGGWLREQVRDFRIVVAGRPRVEMAPYHALVRELDLVERVEFRLGYLEEEELPRLIDRARVVVFPYRSVDQSGVAVAACTLGKAIVATRCGGLEEIVRDADNGILVPVDDDAALAYAIATILLDDDLRGRLEANSSRYARESLSWSRIADRTISAYMRATGTSQRGYDQPSNTDRTRSPSDNRSLRSYR